MKSGFTILRMMDEVRFYDAAGAAVQGLDDACFFSFGLMISGKMWKF